jgi:hypothetical protein
LGASLSSRANVYKYYMMILLPSGADRTVLGLVVVCAGVLAVTGGFGFKLEEDAPPSGGNTDDAAVPTGRCGGAIF